MRSKLSIVGLSGTLVAAVLALASCGQPVPFTQVEVPSPLSWFHAAAPPAAPQQLFLQTDDGTPLEADSWTNQPAVELGADLAASATQPVTIEAEFAPEQQPLTGAPNVTGKRGEAMVASPDMEPGQAYHWALRIRGEHGRASAWVRYPGTIGYQPTPPPAPAIQALPHDGWLGTAKAQLSWQAEGDAAGIAGFAYTLDQSPTAAPPARLATANPSASVTIPKDGDWYFHVRTLDTAGNASPTATLPLHLDSVKLAVQAPKVTVDGSWNPMLGPLAVEVHASKAAHLALQVLPETSSTPVRTIQFDGKDASLKWDGKDGHGAAVPPGTYWLRLDASDKTGRTAEAVAQEPLPLTDKRIVVSLSQEKLWAYEGDKVVLESLVTTGGPELPTPVGTFHILSKMSPFTFHSPWPKGSPYWYADSPTSYAMLFESSGYFIHDAPWRSWYGPGSNATDGQPGGNGTGTHGCVNVPLSVQAKLFAWTPVGTPVIVQD